ncbi:MAG: FAD-dependent oxidoreductase [Clostridia bacterium]|nr:FAD-dependent oxidoreductase [Clostridia bacterium]
MKDLIIIGAGPAGLTAAIYALRAKKSVLLIEKAAMGGQMTFSPLIENYPGMLALSGNELADKMVDHALSLGADVELDEVTGIEDKGDYKVVKALGGEYEAKAVIVATGAKHRHLGVDREEELTGRGVSYCAVCDGAFFAGQDVVLAGGGNSAMQEALLLSETCKSVTMIQNLAFLTGEETLKEKLAAKENISVIYESVVTGIEGGDALTGVTIKNTATGETRTISADGLFVAIGLLPDTGAFEGTIDLNEYGYVAADERCLTNVPGVFTAGDCRTKAVRQVSTAAADGAVAALAAVRYIG